MSCSCSWCPRSLRTADDDLAPRASGPHFGGLVGSSGAVMCAERVDDAAVLGGHVEPHGRALADPDLEGPVGALELHLAAHDLVEADVAVGGLDVDRAERTVDPDRPVGALHSELAGDLADRGVTVRVLDRGAAFDPADADAARGALDVAVPDRHGDRDGARAGAEVEGAGLVEGDVAGTGLHGARGEPALGSEVAVGDAAPDVGARRQLDRDVDRLGDRKPRAPAPRGVHAKPAVGELDLGLLGRPDVARSRRATGPHLDERVVAVACDEPHVRGGDVEGDRDRFRGRENRHDVSFCGA